MSTAGYRALVISVYFSLSRWEGRGFRPSDLPADNGRGQKACCHQNRLETFPFLVGDVDDHDVLLVVRASPESAFPISGASFVFGIMGLVGVRNGRVV